MTLYKKKILLKNSFCVCFYLTSFCCFTFKNTPICSFKYFERSDVIVVKKKSLSKVY